MRGLPLRNFCDKRKQSSSLELLSEAKISQDIILRNFCNKREQKQSFTLIMPSEAKISHLQSKCGNSSVGRAQPCQGWGRGFESRFPLNFSKVPAQVVKLVYTLL